MFLLSPLLTVALTLLHSGSASSTTKDSKDASSIPVFDNYHPGFFPEHVTDDQMDAIYAKIAEKCETEEDRLACYLKYFPDCTLQDLPGSEERYASIKEFPGILIDGAKPGMRFQKGFTLGYHFIVLKSPDDSKKECKNELEIIPAPVHGFVTSSLVGVEDPKILKAPLTFLSFSPKYPSVGSVDVRCLYAMDGLLKVHLDKRPLKIEFTEKGEVESKQWNLKDILYGYKLRRALAELYNALRSRNSTDPLDQLFTFLSQNARIHHLHFRDEAYRVGFVDAVAEMIYAQISFVAYVSLPNHRRISFYNFSGILLETPRLGESCPVSFTVVSFAPNEKDKGSSSTNRTLQPLYRELIHLFDIPDDSESELLMQSFKFVHTYHLVYYHLCQLIATTFANDPTTRLLYLNDAAEFKTLSLKAVYQKADISEMLFGLCFLRNFLFHMQNLPTIYHSLYKWLGLEFKEQSISVYFFNILDHAILSLSDTEKSNPKIPFYQILFQGAQKALSKRNCTAIELKIWQKHANFTIQFSSFQQLPLDFNSERVLLRIPLENARDIPLVLSIALIRESASFFGKIETVKVKRLYSGASLRFKAKRSLQAENRFAFYSSSSRFTIERQILTRIRVLKEAVNTFGETLRVALLNENLYEVFINDKHIEILLQVKKDPAKVLDSWKECTTIHKK